MYITIAQRLYNEILFYVAVSLLYSVLLILC